MQRKILVCLSGAPSNADIIRAAGRMAEAENAEFSAVYVETPRYARMSEKEKAQVRGNMALAEKHGARVDIVAGDDIPFQIAEYARLSGVDTVFVGQSQTGRRTLASKPGLTDVLARQMPDIELHIIPDGAGRNRRHRSRGERAGLRDVLRDAGISLGVLAAATGLGYLFTGLHFTNSNIIMTYLLGVLLIAMLTSRRCYSLVSSVTAVFLFNYLFVKPTFSVFAVEAGYPVTFLVMLLAAFTVSTLTIRLKENARQSAQLSFRTEIISETDRMLAQVREKAAIEEICLRQSEKLLRLPVKLCGEEAEAEAAEALRWVWENLRPAGPGFEAFSQSGNIYYPLSAGDRIYGVLSIGAEGKPLEPQEAGALRSVLGECALALENEQNAREKEAAALRMENERLRSNLLRSISHDLRTPLTSISGIASNLLAGEDRFDAETRRGLYRDIHEDSVWLIRLVENLLASTRIEEGSVRLKRTTAFADELISEAVRHVRPEEQGRTVTVPVSDELLAVNADAGLAVQVLVNLLNNALTYSPPDAEIRAEAERDGEFIRFSVRNRGSRISDGEKARLFEMFYVGSRSRSDGRRGLGLGLALCRSIVEAHGGTIEAGDFPPDGTEFRFTLPAEEVTIHDE